LTKLNYLYLGYNHFTGSIPTQVANMRALMTLELASNRYHHR
jgi:hypothetical protein